MAADNPRPWPPGIADALREAMARLRNRSVSAGLRGGAAPNLGRVAVPVDHEQAWHARVGDVLTQALAAGFRYGPVSRRWRGPALVVGANWAWNRRPYRATERDLGPAENWPSPAAACSPFVEVVLRMAYELRDSRFAALSKSIKRGLKLAGLAEHVRHAHPKDYRVWDFDHLPSPLPAALCAVLYTGHVVLLVDCDRVPVVRDGRRLSGLWVIGADGGFADEKNEKGLIVRRYSLAPLTCESAAARADRQRSRPDKKRRFAVVGFAAPERLPEAAPRLEVG